MEIQTVIKTLHFVLRVYNCTDKENIIHNSTITHFMTMSPHQNTQFCSPKFISLGE